MKIYYKGFEIIKWAAFYKIKDLPGTFTWISDAKSFIDWWHDKQDKLKNIRQGR